VLTVPSLKSGKSSSEDVYMMGYPLELQYETSGPLNRGFPIALVAKGCLALLPGPGSPRKGEILIAGQIDEGFSGGPVVVTRNPNCPWVIGVISYNLRKRTEETLRAGDKLLVSHPANLVAASVISVATDLIDAQGNKSA
jgi:hypothetical protein